MRKITALCLVFTAAFTAFMWARFGWDGAAVGAIICLYAIATDPTRPKSDS